MSFGNGGWVALEGSSVPGLTYVRFRLVGKQLKVSEVYVRSDDQPIEPSDLRTLPLSLIESIANDELGRIQFQAVTEPSPPDLGEALATAFPGGMSGDMPVEQEFRMTTGPQDGLTDEFLQEVARAYRAATARGERPNVAISKQTGYPLKSVQRWVFTARQRGVMPPGRKGRAS